MEITRPDMSIALSEGSQNTWVKGSYSQMGVGWVTKVFHDTIQDDSNERITRSGRDAVQAIINRRKVSLVFLQWLPS